MELNPSMTTALVCGGLLGTVIFLLGANVTRWRAVTGKQGGNQMPTDPASPLLIAQRAHGNASEYVPTLLVLYAAAAALSDSWWTITLIVGATAARLLHAAGMLAARSLAERSPWRELGAVATYVFGAGLGISVLVGALVS